MKHQQYTADILPFLKKHWFTLSLLVIVLMAFAGKNLNVDFRLHAPDATEEETPKSVKPLLHKPEKKIKRSSKITDVAVTGNMTKTSMFPIFDQKEEEALPADVNPVLASEEVVKSFIRRFAKVAIAEMDKYSIPASITLAQSLLASQSATSIIVNESNNYFNLECGDSWSEKTKTYDGTCMRYYESAWRSFRDHSLYLSSGDFQHLTNLERTDYVRWAKGLELAGYSPDRLYAEKLERIIEQYDLSTFDAMDVNVLAER